MKNLITTCLFLLFCLNLVAQNDSIPQERGYNYHDSFNDYWRTVTFKIGGGVFMPLGELKKYFNTSPLVELSLDFPVTDNKSIELALQFVIPKQRIPFQYVRDNEDIEAEASLLINPLVRFKKVLGNPNSSKFILGLGIGASVISSNQKVNSSNNEDTYEITSFLVAPSLDYVKSFKNNEQLTLSFGIHYSPYKIRGAIQEDIGSIALTPRILYSF
ncbi:hypothetical protein [Winogradskyella luteola]|uniref:Outer membrane protein beta-barrel domain-containing protein n=1 Tax=Winogradskyella luteola TaxID=2828330 RepID=A0A9X1JNB7_9FLAO|nr:hypothetical protein [Winogradskyella luteola]MBV7269231.1 hypothetical protein [Winogradskyella luteola]